MIAYFDTSALFPLLLAEESRERCRQMWLGAEIVCSTRLLYVEASAAVYRAARSGRATQFDFRRALQLLDELWEDVLVLELDDQLMHLAASAAGAEGLRGYDATHCAAGLLIASSPDGIAVSGDGALLDAWTSNGATVVDINA